jgi:S1-C subfamily serine protease
MNALVLLLAMIGQPAHVGTVLDFTAPAWCAPCRKMEPVIAEMIRDGYPIKVVDFDREQAKAKRYNITSVPTLVLVDPSGNEVARLPGYHTYNEVGRWQKANENKLPLANAERPVDASKVVEQDRSKVTIPVETCVRIRVGNSVGSGTIVSADGVVVTCAHIFKGGGKITVEVFDNGRQAYAGTKIAVDPQTDLGLIKIAAKKPLRFAPIAPKSWKPKINMGVFQIGCPEGAKPASFATRIMDVNVDLGDNSPWLGIQCEKTPKQGRSGGGLFTDDGYLFAVCDFASPMDSSGLYSGPDTIYALLDKNSLASLYEPQTSKPVAIAHAATASDPEEVNFKLFQKWFKRCQPPAGPVGPVGPIGPQGLTGATGAAGKDGVNGTNGVDGKDGKDGTGTPVDLTAILARLTAAENKIAALQGQTATLQSHDILPTKVGVISPSGNVVSQYVFPDYAPNSNPSAYSGQVRARIGIDLTKSATNSPK